MHNTRLARDLIFLSEAIPDGEFLQYAVLLSFRNCFMTIIHRHGGCRCQTSASAGVMHVPQTGCGDSADDRFLIVMTGRLNTGIMAQDNDVWVRMLQTVRRYCSISHCGRAKSRV